jgi:hypothetical protein
MSEVDLGWADVLRRAERRAPRRRLVLLAAVAAAALGGGPALGVLLTRPGPPQLPADQITGSVSTIVDPHNGLTLVEWARWKGHDGICYLVPRVHAGCMLRGRRSGWFVALPVLRRLRESVRTHRRWIIVRPARFQVVALAGGKAKIVRKR